MAWLDWSCLIVKMFFFLSIIKKKKVFCILYLGFSWRFCWNLLMESFNAMFNFQDQHLSIQLDFRSLCKTYYWTKIYSLLQGQLLILLLTLTSSWELNWQLPWPNLEQQTSLWATHMGNKASADHTTPAKSSLAAPIPCPSNKLIGW